MILPVPWQRGQVCCIGEKALLHAHLAVAAARGTRRRLRAGLGARAFAGFAFLHRRNADARFGSARRVFERDLEVVAQIGAAKHRGARAPAAEDVAEDVAEGIREAAEPGARACGRRIDARVPVVIVRGALVRVGEDFVGFFGFLEVLFRFRIVRIAVRMMLHRELAIRLLDVVFRGVFVDPEHLVIISFCHGSLSAWYRNASTQKCRKGRPGCGPPHLLIADPAAGILYFLSLTSSYSASTTLPSSFLPASPEPG